MGFDSSTLREPAFCDWQDELLTVFSPDDEDRQRHNRENPTEGAKVSTTDTKGATDNASPEDVWDRIREIVRPAAEHTIKTVFPDANRPNQA